MERLDVLVIGAGQAGLAMAYYLKKAEKRFLVIGKEKRVGEVWRTRYDSLRLFTPRWYSSLPGMALPGGEPQGDAGKDELADYLEQYARHYELPVQLETEVHRLIPIPGGFRAETNLGEYEAARVVVASGPFQRAYVPVMSEQLDASVYQVHTSEYCNPGQLQEEGAVLVVGAGNSGAQIAVELAEAGRQVYLAAGHPIKYMPLQVLGKSIFWWFKKLGILSAPKSGRIGRLLSGMPDPIFGYELRAQVKRGRVALKPRTADVSGKEAVFADGSRLAVSNLIWATGFRSDYRWLAPELSSKVLDERGKPVHRRGVTAVSGLYFLGLPWQHTRGSALIGGVSDDAAYLANYVEEGGKK